MTLSDQEQEIVRVGFASAALLANPDFSTVIQALMVEGFSRFTESQPQQAAEREQTYNLIRGLQAIEAELRARVHAKDEIERKLDEAHAAEIDDLISDADLGAQD